ncbi:MAG: hypothetical protein QOH90_941 [Actinomycetota bacterium]|nr:hypothetical protein [Actinomycetota bacterium]
MTFSIVARDVSASGAPEWGVAVASKFLAVGAAVPWARADAGAVATQALANLAYGPEGLDLLAEGRSAEEVVAALTGADDEREHRQLGVVDAEGRASTYTGSECLNWAGGRTGPGFCCQGNILTGPDVVDAMVDAFESTEGELAVRLIAAIKAGDAKGGDSRGRQSAALLVVRRDGGYGGGIDKAVDLRVEDHAAPIDELQRLFDLHNVYFPRKEDLEFLGFDGGVSKEVAEALTRLGYDAGPGESYDAQLRGALFSYVGTANLEERWSEENVIERGILEHLRAGRT